MTRSNGKVPPRALLQPPPPAPLEKGKAFSCQYLSHDTQSLWGLRNKCNLTNCPHTPARFLSPVPPQRGGGKDKRHPDKQEKKPNSTQRGAENQLSPVPQNTTGAKDNSTSLKLELHSERAGVQLPEELSRGHGKDQSWTAHGRAPQLPPALCPSPHPATGTHHESPVPAVAKQN